MFVTICYIFCIAIVVAILIAIFLQNDFKEKKTLRYTHLLFAVLLYLSDSILTELLDGKPNLSMFNYVTNLLAFIFIDYIIAAFASYLYALLDANNGKDKKGLDIIFASCAIETLTVIYLTFKGSLFAIENGFYVEKELINIPYYITCGMLVQLMLVVLVNYKCFNTKQLVVIVFYIVSPIAPALIEMQTGYYMLSGMSITLSALLVYLLIQNSAIEKVKIREVLLEEMSTTDLLTGLLNRRSYLTYISNIHEQQNVGVIYADLNNLKFKNDHYGHTKGDEYIKQFSTMLTDSFRKEGVFRISGDEFIVVVIKVEKTIFESRVKKFINMVQSNDYIASIGYSFGAGECYDRLVIEAEDLMYKEKEKYHNIKNAK